MYGDNYGACLQAFALQKVVAEYGHTIEILRYSSNKEANGSHYLNTLKRIGFRGLIDYISNYKYINLKKKWFNDFRNDNLSFSTNVLRINENDSAICKEYDIFICGSDMIWSQDFSEDWDYYFLGFAKKKQSYSYAPSFGQNKVSSRNEQCVKKYLQDFADVSCREMGGVELIKEISSVNATHVADPTLLLNKEQWNQYINNNNRIISEKYALTYLFGENDINRQNIIDKIAKNIGNVYSIPGNKKEYDRFPVDKIDPIDYLRLFRDAEYIVTDTFHGLMFSVIFRKPFIVLERTDTSVWAKHSDRMVSALQKFGLESRYIKTDYSDIESLIKLDYGEYEEIIQDFRCKSLEYLKSILVKQNI